MNIKKGLLNLPPEILEIILFYLPLSSIYSLGASCKKLHFLLMGSYSSFWSLLVKKKINITLVSPDIPQITYKDFYGDGCIGLIHDSSLRGNREVYLLYSDEFKLNYPDQRSFYCRYGGDALLSILRPKTNVESSIDHIICLPSRLALFGPGLESQRTNMLVHKLININLPSLYSNVAGVPGLPGGFGTGFRFEFRKTFPFEMLSLIFADSSKREKNLPKAISGSQLHPYVSELLPTMHSLCFSVDYGRNSENFNPSTKKDLWAMIEGCEKLGFIPPVVVLACRLNKDPKKDLATLAYHLKLPLNDSSGPSFTWGIFDVNMTDLVGLEKALDWLLYRIEKGRRDLAFHKYSSNSY